jgi:hypothetical protein
MEYSLGDRALQRRRGTSYEQIEPCIRLADSELVVVANKDKARFQLGPDSHHFSEAKGRLDW